MSAQRRKTLPVLGVISLTVLVIAGLILQIKYISDKAAYVRAAYKWEYTSYTIDEIMSMADENDNALDNITDDDCTEEALKAYNIMLGYAENVAGVEYKVYDFYHVGFQQVKSYVIKIVLDGYTRDGSNDAYIAADERILMLSCNEDGSGIKGQIEPFLMARRWFGELSESVYQSFPDYHVNLWYTSLDHMVPAVTANKYPENDDYTYYFTEDVFSSNHYRLYDNDINIFVPPGTDENDAQKIFEELEPLLKEYFVTDVAIIAPNDDEAMQSIIDDEKFAGNLYDYNRENVKWSKHFKL